jgi:hypothetical protein
MGLELYVRMELRWQSALMRVWRWYRTPRSMNQWNSVISPCPVTISSAQECLLDLNLA